MKNRLLKFLNYKRQFVKKKRYGVGCISNSRKLPKNEDLSKDSAIKKCVKGHFAIKAEDLAKLININITKNIIAF